MGDDGMVGDMRARLVRLVCDRWLSRDVDAFARSGGLEIPMKSLITFRVCALSLTSAATLAAISGCDGSDGSSSLIVVSEEEACDETQCPDGGIRIDFGLDVNGDGDLDPSEVTDSVLLCGGTLPPPPVLGGDFTIADDWTVTGAAAIDTTATGNADPGEALISTTAACAGDTVSQTLSFPPTCASQPLALRMAVRSIGFPSLPMPAGAVDYGGALQQGRQLLFTDQYADDLMCLGAAAYGGDVSIGLSHHAGCFATNGIAYDNLELVAAPSSCPLPGKVLNGSFDDEVAGWRTEVYAGGVFRPAIDDGAHVGLLSVPAQGCPDVRARTEASVPLASDVPNPALEFRWRSTGLASAGIASAGFEAEVYNGPGYLGEFLGERPLTFTDSVNYTTERICLDPNASGIVVNLILSLRGSGRCADTPAADVFVDDFRVVDEPSCP